jgi:hypothetical protein
VGAVKVVEREHGAVGMVNGTAEGAGDKRAGGDVNEVPGTGVAGKTVLTTYVAAKPRFSTSASDLNVTNMEPL